MSEENKIICNGENEEKERQWLTILTYQGLSVVFKSLSTELIRAHLCRKLQGGDHIFSGDAGSGLGVSQPWCWSL